MDRLDGKRIGAVLVRAGAPLLLLALLAFTVVGCADSLERNLTNHVKYLADDAREGRGIGTNGLEQASEYIAEQLLTAGLEPLFGDDGYYQPFKMSWGIEIMDGCRLSSGDVSLALREEFQPAGFSGTGKLRSSAVFAGYGISADEYGYDDYEEVAADGKIVVVLDGEPNADSDNSLFEGRQKTDHAALRTKAILAKTKGAAGLIVVVGSPGDESSLPMLRTNEPYRDVGIPIVQVTRAGFARLFPRMNLDLVQRSIDANEAPRSMSLGDSEIALAVDVKRSEVPVRNVGGKLSGGEDIIIVGAHYDHLGYGQSGSRETEAGVIHNGADDNASGAAALIETARRLAEDPPGPTIWFVAFTGEEAGLVGSNHFAANPPEAIEKVKFMLNYDMVGRMRENELTVFGIKSAEELPKLADGAGEGLGLELSLTGGGFGASDQTSFYSAGVPVAHLMTALHADYHTGLDDVDKIRFDGIAKTVRYGVSLVNTVSDDDISLTYVEQEQPREGRGGRGNIKVTFGIIPDFSQPDSLHGLRLDGVRPGTPASAGGLERKDVVTRMGDVIIDNIYDFTFALKRHEPGDTVQVEFARDGESLSTRVVLVARDSGGRGGHPSGRGK
jgi:Zn-dependent M28 family amino/carboxypeptidase